MEGRVSSSSVNGGHAARNGETLSAISRRVVALLKEYTGKGPVKARTYYWSDLLVVLMSDGYTPVENTLLKEGYSPAVLSQRAVFQEVMIPHFTHVVEQELGRTVVACMNFNHHAPDYNAELFLLAPQDVPNVAAGSLDEGPTSNGSHSLSA